MVAPYTTLTGLRREQMKISVPDKSMFQVFIKTPCICTTNCECYFKSYIPNIASNSNDIYLEHETTYSIGLLNFSNARANAHFFVDGKYLGMFRINNNADTFQLHRSLESNRSFVFMSTNSETAHMTGIPLISDSKLKKAWFQTCHIFFVFY